MFTKGNPIGMETRFGPQWPGQRCGAKTQAGAPCKRPAYARNGRCHGHGGASTGPRTPEGLQRLAEAHTVHGRYTKEKRAEARAAAAVGRRVRAQLLNIKQKLVAAGLIDPKTFDRL